MILLRDFVSLYNVKGYSPPWQERHGCEVVNTGIQEMYADARLSFSFLLSSAPTYGLVPCTFRVGLLPQCERPSQIDPEVCLLGNFRILSTVDIHHHILSHIQTCHPLCCDLSLRFTWFFTLDLCCLLGAGLVNPLESKMISHDMD